MCFVCHITSEIPVFDTRLTPARAGLSFLLFPPLFLFLVRSGGKINCRGYEEETVADGFGGAVRTMRFKSSCGVYTKVTFLK